MPPQILAILTPFLTEFFDTEGKRLAAWTLKEIPVGAAELLAAVLALPAVQAELQVLEADAIKTVEDLGESLLGKLKGWASDIFHTHPKVVAIVSAVEANVVAGQVVSLTADEVKALYGKRMQGEWMAFRAWLGLP